MLGKENTCIKSPMQYLCFVWPQPARGANWLNPPPLGLAMLKTTRNVWVGHSSVNFCSASSLLRVSVFEMMSFVIFY